MYYDLHIHSCLSPCSDDSMTINNIVNMALIKELELIAITDHNTTKHLELFKQIANQKIHILYGVELQTKEEIHILAYFKNDQPLKQLQNWLDEHLITIKNNPAFFGNQYILDKNDQIIDQEPNLLITSLNTTLEQTIQFIHELNGKVVLAHVFNQRYSIFSQLGFIPNDLCFDGIEVKNEDEIHQIKTQYPQTRDCLFLINSDAHQLIDISEPIHTITTQQLKNFWR